MWALLPNLFQHDALFFLNFCNNRFIYYLLLVTLIFGKSKKHFMEHWNVLFQSFDDCKSWSEFEDNFCGVTMDWSAALGSAFLASLSEFSKRFSDGNLSEDQLKSFVRKCGIHFYRSVTRVARNRGAVKTDEEKDEYLSLVAKMVSTGTTPAQFARVCKDIIKKFPKLNYSKYY